MRVAIALACACALSGCVGPTYYYRDGGTNEALQRDTARCRNQAAMLPVTPAPPASEDGAGLGTLGAGLTNLANREQYLHDCMRAQGWVKVQPPRH